MDEEKSTARELDEKLARIKAKIDTSAEKLKGKLGSSICQIEGVIDSADQLMDQLIDRVNDTAGQTRDVLKSAEKVAEHLEEPVDLMKKYPWAALTGAVVAGMFLGLMFRSGRSSESERSRRLKIAP